ncbi:MAG: hypothetical protein R2751_03985 [Bacteroidales bacterium]
MFENGPGHCLYLCPDLPANLSTAAILFVTAFSLMFVGRVPMKYLFLFRRLSRGPRPGDL